MKEFISYLVDNEYLVLKEEETIDNFIQLLKKDIAVPEQNTCKIDSATCKYIDILFSSNEAKFVCVIENKLDADINTDDKGKTQLEYYKNWIESHNEYKDYEHKLFLFLSPIIEKLQKKKIGSVCKLKEENKDYKFADKEFGEYLKELNYKTIDYSDIVLFIHEYLKNYKEEIYNVEEEKEEKKGFYKKLCTIYKTKDSNNDNNLENLKELSENPEKIGLNFDRFNVAMDEIMNTYAGNIRSINFVLKQYVEYWVYFAKYNNGYSKIVDIPCGEDEVYSVYSQDLKNFINDFDKENTN